MRENFGAKAAAAQLGHSSLDTTRKFYIDRAHTAPDNAAALDAFNPFSDNKLTPKPKLKVIND